MPNFDRSGPRGAGPLTGRGNGLCGRRRGGATIGAALGQGLARRRRGGRAGGLGRGPGGIDRDDAAAYDGPATPAAEESDPAERRAVLKAERNRLKSRLHEVEETLKAIGRGNADNADA